MVATSNKYPAKVVKAKRSIHASVKDTNKRTVADATPRDLSSPLGT